MTAAAARDFGVVTPAGIVRDLEGNVSVDTDDLLFEAATPVGLVVRVTRKRWELITTTKHPVMAGQGRRSNMAEVKIFHDREGQTLTVWFTDPSLEYVSEETGDEVVLMKDRSGRVIGFEKLNFSVPESDSVHIALETAPA